MQHCQRGGRWTPQWVTLRNLVELLARMDLHEPAAVLYGACIASSTAPPTYGAEADRLHAVVATLGSALGQQNFVYATTRGAALDADEAMAFASAAIRQALADDQGLAAASQ